MNRKYLAALLVTIMMLTAGCSFLTGDQPQATDTPEVVETPNTPTTTTTPPSQTEQKETASERPTEPQMKTLTGFQLLGIHSESVTNISSFSANSKTRITQGNDTFTTIYNSKYDNGEFLISRPSQNNFTASIHQYGSLERNVRFSKINSQNTTYLQVMNSDYTVRRIAIPPTIQVYFGSNYTKSGSTTINGVSVTKYTANEQNISLQRTQQRLISYNGTVYVDSNGVIRKYTIEADVAGPRSITVTGELSGINDTTITQPSWISTAKKSSVNLNASRVDSDTFKITNTGSGTLYPQYSVSFFSRNVSGFGVVDQSLQPSESIYVSVSNNQVKISTTQDLSGEELESPAQIIVDKNRIILLSERV